MPNNLLFIGGPAAGHLPHVLEPEDCDAWHNPTGETRWGEILAVIVNAGYAGIKIEVLGTTPRRQLHWRLAYDSGTPEGRMAEWLGALAKAGSPLPPTSEALAILGRVYREQGLPTPMAKVPAERRAQREFSK